MHSAQTNRYEVMSQPLTLVDEMRHLGADELRRVIDSLPLLAWTCNGTGSELFLGRQWACYTGLSIEEMSDSQNMPFHPEDRDWVTQWRACLAKGIEFTTPEFRLRRYDGVYRWFHARAVPLADAEGHLVRWYGVTLDIDETRSAREQVERLNEDLERRIQQRTAALMAANRELESFAYAVSHDLRSPLRAMGGFCELLRVECGHLLPPQGHEYLNRIARTNAQMNDLIDGLLALSRIEHDELHNEYVDLSTVARDLLQELAATDGDRIVHWFVQPSCQAYGDSRMLQVVMRNLIGNAWKFTMHNPRGEIHVNSEVRDGVRWYCVSDNGAGFDMGYAGKLFQPFQRLHRHDEFQGQGIGLATVQRIVHRHGGRILGDSAPGRGATFRFSLQAPCMGSLPGMTRMETAT